MRRSKAGENVLRVTVLGCRHPGLALSATGGAWEWLCGSWVEKIEAGEPQDMSVVCEVGESTVTSMALGQTQDICTTLLGI